MIDVNCEKKIRFEFSEADLKELIVGALRFNDVAIPDADKLEMMVRESNNSYDENIYIFECDEEDIFDYVKELEEANKTEETEETEDVEADADETWNTDGAVS